MWIVMRLQQQYMNQLKVQMHLLSSVRSLLDLFLVLKYVAFRNRPAASSFVLLLSSFLNNFKDTLHIVLRSAKFLANSLLGIRLLVQIYYFMPMKLSYFW